MQSVYQNIHASGKLISTAQDFLLLPHGCAQSPIRCSLTGMQVRLRHTFCLAHTPCKRSAHCRRHTPVPLLTAHLSSTATRAQTPDSMRHAWVLIDFEPRGLHRTPTLLNQPNCPTHPRLSSTHTDPLPLKQRRPSPPLASLQPTRARHSCRPLPKARSSWHD